AATVALAFDNPLSADAVREAYFIATGDTGKRAAFFDRYTRHPPTPKSGPAISSIEIETPFAAVAQDIADNSLNIRAPDAVKRFYGKPAHFRVRVEIAFTQTYPPSASTSMQLGSFWDKFHVRLNQGDEIASISQTGRPIASDQTPSGYIGAIVVASYDPNKIHSGPATVVVTGPDDARAEASFDLNALR
ncbi:MAG TPA: hypothetical protein VIY69_15715, partial [Candidatus Acidoferrales bacterium]